MFTKGKTTGLDTPLAPEPSLQSPRRQMPSRMVASIITSDVQIAGTVTSEGEIQIDGRIEGDVRGAKIAIGESGEVHGDVCAEDVEVRGKVNGSIRGRKVALASKAVVDGDITHSQLAVEAGARFEGKVRYSAEPLAALAALPAPKPAEATPPLGAQVSATPTQAAPVGAPAPGPTRAPEPQPVAQAPAAPADHAPTEAASDPDVRPAQPAASGSASAGFSTFRF